MLTVGNVTNLTDPIRLIYLMQCAYAFSFYCGATMRLVRIEITHWPQLIMILAQISVRRNGQAHRIKPSFNWTLPSIIAEAGPRADASARFSKPGKTREQLRGKTEFLNIFVRRKLFAAKCFASTK